jgi:predicted nuclease of predicted toxin-antitoxin system
LPTRRILIDSNTYFRLAEIIGSLLTSQFGPPPPYQIRLLAGTTHELYSSSRLRSKFSWADEVRHREERARGKLIVRAEEKQAIRSLKPFLFTAVSDLGLSCSRFDVECFATATCLGIPLVTDDLDLLSLAAEYGYETMTSLELLKLMLDEGRVSMDDIQAVVLMWQYLDDCPSKFVDEFERLFGVQPERLH